MQWEGQAGKRQSRGHIKSRNKLCISNQAHQTAELSADHKNSDQEPFASGLVEIAFMVKDQQDQQLQKIESKNTWFLDSCTSRHLYNNPSLFTNKRAKSINFIKTIE